MFNLDFSSLFDQLTPFLMVWQKWGENLQVMNMLEYECALIESWYEYVKVWTNMSMLWTQMVIINGWVWMTLEYQWFWMLIMMHEWIWYEFELE